ncbi:putative nucleoprotein [Anopheles marajoara virus]|uniref:Nucleoprotein n=1 Tax=Anopheles marajoara virus TaxID=2546225 RepID=A0AAE5YFE7_9MONO|nr:putative nucleoprotein [Anopheles marajoara virus]QBK47211.1 putative nucleoprotein [Anopheles marajoara virus]
METITMDNYESIQEMTEGTPARWEMAICEKNGTEIRAGIFVSKDRKNLYAGPGALGMIRSFFTGADCTKSIDASEYVESAKYRIPTYNNYTYMRKITLATPKLELVTNGQLNIAHLFCVLCHFPGLKDVYQDYLLDLDDGVAIVGKDEEFSPSVMSHTKEDLPTAEQRIHTAAFMKVAATCALYLMTKTLDPEATNHLSSFLDKRIKAVSYVIGLNASGVKAEPVISFLSNGDKIADLMSYFPNIKKAVFQLVVNRSDSLSMHVTEILRGTQLTLFKMVVDFLTTPEPTMLHILPTIISEIREFIKAWTAIQAKYGASWEYFKLTDPMGVGTSVRKLEKLGAAAYSWAYTTTGQQSLMNLKTVKLVPRFENLARKTLASELLTSEQISLKEQLDEIRKAGFLSSINPNVQVDGDGIAYIPENAK